MKKNTYKILLIIMIALISLSSCSPGTIRLDPNITLEADVNIDQTVDLKLEMQIKKIEYDIFNLTEEALANIENGLASEGFTVERKELDETIGIVARKKVDNRGAVQASALDVDNLIETEDFTLVTDYKVNQSFKLKDTLIHYGLVEQNAILDEILNQSTVKFILKLPIKPKEHNASEVQDEGKTMVWNIDPIEENLIQLRVSVPNIRNIAIFGALALIGFILFVLVFKRVLGLFSFKKSS